MAKDVKIVHNGHDLDGAIFQNAASNDIIQKIMPALQGVSNEVKSSGKTVSESVDKNTDATKESSEGAIKSFFSGFTSGFGEIAGGIKEIGLSLYDQKATVAGTIDSIGKIIGGLGSSLAGAFSGTIGKLTGFGDVLSSIGSMVSGGVRAIENYSETLDAMSKQGMAFSGDIFAMKDAAAEARMSLVDYATMMKSNSNMIAGVGGTMTEAAEKFSSYSSDFFNDTAGYGIKLRQLGMSYSDINDTLIFNRKMNQLTNLEDAESRHQSMESAMRLATEMDSMAKLTGVERKQMQDDIAKSRNKAQVEATIMQQMLRGNKQTEEAFVASRGAMSQYSEGMQQAYDEILAYGAPVSKEAQGLVNALGDGAESLYELANAAKEGRSIDEIGELNDRLQDSVVEMLTDPDKLNLGRLVGLSSAEVASQYGDLLMGPMGNVAKAMIAEGDDFKSSAEGMARFRQRVEEEQKKQQSDGKTTGQSARQALLAMQDALKTSGEAMNKALIGDNGLIQTSETTRDAFILARDGAKAFGDWMQSFLHDENVEVTDKDGETSYVTKFQANQMDMEANERRAERQSAAMQAQAGIGGLNTASIEAQQSWQMQRDAEAIEARAEERAAQRKDLSEFLNGFSTIIKSDKVQNNEVLREEYEKAAHTIKEMADQNGSFFKEIWPKLKALGDTGPAMLAAAHKQTGIADTITALSTAGGLDKDDTEDIVDAVNQRLENDTGINESRGIIDKGLAMAGNAVDVISGWFGDNGTATKSFQVANEKVGQSAELVAEHSKTTNDALQNLIQNTSIMTTKTTENVEQLSNVNQESGITTEDLNQFQIGILSNVKEESAVSLENFKQIRDGILSNINQESGVPLEELRTVANELSAFGQANSKEAQETLSKLSDTQRDELYEIKDIFQNSQGKLDAMIQAQTTTIQQSNLAGVQQPVTPVVEEKVEPKQSSIDELRQAILPMNEGVLNEMGSMQESTQKTNQELSTALNNILTQQEKTNTLLERQVTIADYQAGQSAQQTELARRSSTRLGSVAGVTA